jgi:acyl-coenzyme A thioesterase PaaI-like protein
MGRLEFRSLETSGFDHAMIRVATDVPAARPQMDWLTMTDTSSAGPTLRAWIRLRRTRFGRWLFARTVCRRAPYFGTIKPRFLDLQPKLCRVAMRKRRAVENHIGTVHALAMGNLCELAAGLCTEVTIPPAMRWILRGMTIEYLAKAESDIVATARLDKTEWADAESVGVPVTVTDVNGKEVVRAVISMYVSPRKGS